MNREMVIGFMNQLLLDGGTMLQFKSNFYCLVFFFFHISGVDMRRYFGDEINQMIQLKNVSTNQYVDLNLM